MVEQYQRTRDAVYLINYHLVWVPKRKKPVLVGVIKAHSEQLLKTIALERGWSMLEMSVQPDYVHLFVSVDTKMAIHQVVNAFKGRTSHNRRKESPELLKFSSLWTHSYFASTAGNVSAEIIQKYIEAQKGL